MDMQSIEQAFSEIDTNNNGFLELDEIRSLMHEVHADITDADLESIIQKADVNGDGKIDIQEFQRLLADF